MKVALDTSPTKSGHQVRGIGSYTKNLQNQFKKIGEKDLNFEFFENGQAPKADIIHFPYFDLFFRTLKPEKNTKTIVTIHDVIPLVFPKYFPVGPRGYINFFFQKQALKKSSAIICDSKTSKEDIANKLSIPRGKIHVVYLAPSPVFRNEKEGLNQIAKKYSLPKEFALYVGDVNWNKNLSGILNAIKISKRNLVLVGKAFEDKNLPETQEIEKLISKLKLKEKITKTGFVPDGDLNKIYNLATVTLMPSYYEGFGLPVLESMACQTPVVCSKVASLAEIAGDDAFYIDPADPKDIAEKIEMVFALSKEKREALSKKLSFHAAKFSWEKTASETIKIYKSVSK